MKFSRIWKWWLVEKDYEGCDHVKIFYVQSVLPRSLQPPYGFPQRFELRLCSGLCYHRYHLDIGTKFSPGEESDIFCKRALAVEFFLVGWFEKFVDLFSLNWMQYAVFLFLKPCCVELHRNLGQGNPRLALESLSRGSLFLQEPLPKHKEQVIDLEYDHSENVVYFLLYHHERIRQGVTYD